MTKKEIILQLTIILFIFSLGFFLRVESTDLYGISDDNKDYYQDQDGLPYMYELDSYYNYRLTKNYLDHGYLGDAIIDGQEWDLHSYYPPGVPMDYPPLIIYLTALIYMLANLFTAVPLLTVCFWLPAFIAPLCGIPAYFFVKKYTNEYGGFAAGILAVTTPFYFIRSVPGWFDTDMFNVLFPILIVWFFIEAVNNDNRKKHVIYTLLAGFSMFLFSLAWNGWQYLFYIIVVFCIFYVIYGIIKKKDIKSTLYFVIIFSAVVLLLVSVFTGYLNVLKAFYGPFQLLILSGNQNPFSIWPDVYGSVSELQVVSFEENVSSMGPVFFGGLLGLFWTLRVLINKEMKEKYLDKMTWFFYIFLVVWIITGLFALFKGVRFIMLLIPPLAISSGMMIGIATGYIKNLKRENLIKILTIILLLLIVVPSVLSNYRGFYMLKPGVNDDFSDVAQWIQNNTDKNTVIITDWSYGHYWTGIADRPVIFDGRLGYVETLPVRQFDSSFKFKDKSPGVSRNYWVYFAFTTDNQSLSSGIFRMIATSGDEGYLTLDEYTKNTTKTVEILKNILGVQRSIAREKLSKEYNLNETQSENILNYTHPQKTKPYILITYGTVGGYNIFKSGSWEFNKRESRNITYSKGDIQLNNTELSTSNGILMNLRDGNVTWNGEVPDCIIKISNGHVKRQYLDTGSDFCIILNLDNKKALVLNKEFENSTFVKLSIEKSKSQFFEQIYEKGNIVVWKPVNQ